ncbi:unnamed protein product [Cuscuta epithymum]|uniref:Uncharacterized protein n=1 Tax=Cuscuta epithymum TaxID=186058 RepID=A0AAV0E9Z2_9ASTE|nr:unnamed protein product [Cuscuta epithymum]CAH9118877.1 unnamed protein product [Cuscuta epithymum]
MDTAPGRFV